PESPLPIPQKQSTFHPRTTKRRSSPRCASAMKIVRLRESTAETLPRSLSGECRQALMRLRKPAACCLNRCWITAHVHPRDKGTALRFAALFVQLKFGAQRRTLQSRLMMHQRHKIVGEFATGVLTAHNIGCYSKAK